ncbi:unnamed protein product [Gemmataceae bacterium]|nr:unnamed protein product [Gemmataceae bacterium]VTT98047.1 unnamed protein product [Gemmataceae bacterium]
MFTPVWDQPAFDQMDSPSSHPLRGVTPLRPLRGPSDDRSGCDGTRSGRPGARTWQAAERPKRRRTAERCDEGGGKISVSKNGTYVAGPNAVVACQLDYYPMAGGTIPATFGGPAPANGKWGPITTNVVPGGQYLVFGGVQMKPGVNPAQWVYTPGSIINVP